MTLLLCSKRLVRWLWLAAPLLIVLAAMPAHAQVIVPPCRVPCPVGPGVFTDPPWLRVDFHHVTITVADQVARTQVDLQFTNIGEALAEGTFLFPLPDAAAVEDLVLTLDGQRISAQLLRADEARAIYDEIVRQYRDPVLLEYVGRSVIQASVFPVPPGESRRVEITYSQVLEADNGLVRVRYPMKAAPGRTVAQASIRVQVQGRDALGAVYSPTHPIAITREGASGFRASFEASAYAPASDFDLYYALANDSISAHLLSYRESAAEDGFFMLLVQPPLADDARVAAKDVILVVDQSGSMSGSKWAQAQNATIAVLEQLGPEDRFNVILFSSGARVFSDRLAGAPAVAEAISWVGGQQAEGATDISGALALALAQVDAERQATILFLTDGLPTEGLTRTADILEAFEGGLRPNVRLFPFGIGDDVDALLLDALAQRGRGTSAYVRPGERIDEAVASLYARVGAPVLTNVSLDISGVRLDDVYPAAPLPDLFAGQQLTLVGRYRDGAPNVTLTLRGEVDGETRTFVYEGQALRARAGGEPFVARLWATRRIGALLNSIRLNGENPELVESIVALSVRYGIITPYTSFLIDENDILSQQGRDAATQRFRGQAQALAGANTGAGAVDAAEAAADMAAAAAPMAPPATTSLPGALDEPGQPSQPQAGSIVTVEAKAFVYRDDVWTDTTFDPATMTTTDVAFLSDAYFALLDAHPAIAPYLALGDALIVVLDGVAYQVTPQ